MQLNPLSSSPVRLGGLQPSGARQARSATSDQAQFSETEAVNSALRATPDVRSDTVARAKELIGSVKYPPTDLIDGISHLLAREGF